MHHSLMPRVIGFMSCLILTLVSFFIVLDPSTFHLDNQMAIKVIFGLACLQAVIQSIFFLNILSEEGPRWNLVVFASTISILIVIVVASIIIMNNLDYRMSL